MASLPDDLHTAEYLTREQVAARYNVHINTVDNWRKRGWLGFIMAGQLVRITRVHLEEFEQRVPENQRVDGSGDDHD